MKKLILYQIYFNTQYIFENISKVGNKITYQ